MFVCPLCKAEFKTEKELNKHFKDNVKCRVMADIFRTESRIRFAREG